MLHKMLQFGNHLLSMISPSLVVINLQTTELHIYSLINMSSQNLLAIVENQWFPNLLASQHP
jgi:hypothetical protein